MLNKVISGGQTGADIGGLKWAHSRGIPTGGYMPHGFRTEDGPKPEWAALYGLIAINVTDYNVRTELNLKDADGTLIFGDEKSSGSKLTKRLCTSFNKQFITIPWPYDSDEFYILSFRQWLYENNIKTLNVAGNRESVNPGIEQAVIDFLNKVFPQ